VIRWGNASHFPNFIPRLDMHVGNLAPRSVTVEGGSLRHQTTAIKLQHTQLIQQTRKRKCRTVRHVLLGANVPAWQMTPSALCCT
jgi:hypothetical protein